MQICAYGSLRNLLPIILDCHLTMSNRKYNNFQIILNDQTLSKEYYSNKLINMYSINMNDLNNNSILVNNEQIIENNKKQFKKQKLLDN